jgi:hypothetical protein
VATPEEILVESRRVRQLQVVVDLVTNLLRQSDLPVEEAAALVAQTRQYALRLFPGREETYDLLYQSRFKRLLAEKYRMI